jgi:hypothetical protein
MLDRAEKAEAAQVPTGLDQAAADGYFKLLTYKDEYEVARVHDITQGSVVHEDMVLSAQFAHERVRDGERRWSGVGIADMGDGAVVVICAASMNRTTGLPLAGFGSRITNASLP